METKKLIDILLQVKNNNKDINEAYMEINGLYGKYEATFPVFDVDTKVKWKNYEDDFWVVEDNGGYDVLIGNDKNKKHPQYNDWWVNKTEIRIPLPVNKTDDNTKKPEINSVSGISLKSIYNKLKTKNEYSPLCKAMGYNEPYEGQIALGMNSHFMTFDDVTNTIKWLFGEGYDIILPKKK